jgi:hypothetical protein
VKSITEKELESQVKDLAKLFGWEYYHPWLSIHSPRGWPDVSLCRPPQLIFLELKTEKGKVSEHQQKWLDLLGQCPGCEVYVVRPSQIEWLAERLMKADGEGQ